MDRHARRPRAAAPADGEAKLLDRDEWVATLHDRFEIELDAAETDAV